MKRKTTWATIINVRRKVLNKYSIVFMVFICWLAFFDKYNFFAQVKLKKSTQLLEAEYAGIKEEIKAAKDEKKDLDLNQEKYGREKYYLHKDDEDVFIIEKNK